VPLKAIALALLAFCVVGCTAFEAYVTPPQGPGTDWPCGYNNTVCDDGTCCGYREQCRDANAMNAEPFCEYVGPDMDTAGASRERPRFEKP